MRHVVACDPLQVSRLVSLRPGRTVAAVGWLLILAGLTAVGTHLVHNWRDPEAVAESATPGRFEREGEATPVWALAYSPDGEHLAAATIGGEVRLKRSAGGPWFTVSHGPGGALGSACCVAFSHDGLSLAAVGSGLGLRSWSVRDGVETDPIDLGTNSANCLAFSGDGKTLAVGGSEGHKLTLWDWETRHRLAVLGGHDSGVKAVAFSADGALLASGDVTGRVVVWEVSSGRARLKFRAHRCPLSSLAFSPDDSRLVTSGNFDTACRVWDAGTGAPLLDLSHTSSGYSALAYSPDGRVVAASGWGEAVTFWDSGTGRTVGSIVFPRSVYAIAFSRNGRTLATGCHDGWVRFSELTGMAGGPAYPIRLSSLQ